jgi:hypothetical protein
VLDFRQCYAALGVPADADWETVRASYRQQIRRWHPDRHAADGARRLMAEEQSKQITAAYRALRQYRRDHGVLPVPVSRTAAPLAEGLSPGAPRRPGKGRYAPADAPRSAADGVRAAPQARPRSGRKSGWAISILVVVVSGIFFLRSERTEQTSQPEIIAPKAPVPPAQGTGAPAASNANARFGITLGSTLGDVIAVQGTPTRVEGDTWYYGGSYVRFERGEVVAWQEVRESPLRIARAARVEMQRGQFRKGSTKDEVRAMQGTPVTETAGVWDYGLSRVYFEHNRVVGWEESPMQPLRVAR